LFYKRGAPVLTGKCVKSDLNIALSYCVESGYRTYEAGVPVALGWAYLANGEKEKAKESAERTQ
jgi:hypothetical protein